MITQLSRVLSPAYCFVQVALDSRKRVLEHTSQLFAAELADVTPMDIFDLFIARERLGSTAIGEGIAVPHIRFADIEQPSMMLLQLANPIDYDARDGKPVDLFFPLLVPDTDAAQDAHIHILKSLTTLLQDETVRTALRAATDEHGLYQIILDHERLQLSRDDALPGLNDDDLL